MASLLSLFSCCSLADVDICSANAQKVQNNNDMIHELLYFKENKLIISLKYSSVAITNIDEF